MLTPHSSLHIYADRLPLNNILAEEITIGYLLLYKSLKETIANSITTHFFSLKKYQILFDYGLILDKKHKSANIITIIYQLWRNKLLKEVGGFEYIINLIQRAQALQVIGNEYTNIKYFINLLYYYYIKRLFLQYSNYIIQLNHLYNLSINEIYYLSNKYLISIGHIYKWQKFNPIHNNIQELLQKINQYEIQTNRLFSGFKDLDRITNGFQYGDLIIIAGRPSMGKTSLAINILYHISVQLKIKVKMFSLEMSKTEILDKLIALTSQIKIEQITTDSIELQNWVTIQDSCKTLMCAPIVLDDHSYSSIEYIKSQCIDNDFHHGLIIIDYLQLIQGRQDHSENRSQEIAIITRELKILAQTLFSTILILSQLNRNIENRANKRPLLSDLRESGCLGSFNLPIIEKRKKHKFIRTLNCFKKTYLFNRTKQVQLKKNPKQYTFLAFNNKKRFLSVTHNHKLLHYNMWQKEDQIKLHHLYLCKQINKINRNLSIELHPLTYIRRLYKQIVYDIVLKNYHNFSMNEYIIHNSIEQDADLVLMLYKDENNADKRIVDVVIAKHRHGPTGAFQLLFHAETCKFNGIYT